MSREGQTSLPRSCACPRSALRCPDEGSARAMQAALGAQLRPVAVSPGLLVYLDQAKRSGVRCALAAGSGGQAGTSSVGTVADVSAT